MERRREWIGLIGSAWSARHIGAGFLKNGTYDILLVSVLIYYISTPIIYYYRCQLF